MVSKGGIVKLRGQQSDTPDQSAARGTTLKLRFRRAIKTGMRKVQEEGKEEMRVALEIRTSLRPERPGTTPVDKAGSETEGERGRRKESPDNPDQSAAEESEAGGRERPERQDRRDKEAGQRKGTHQIEKAKRREGDGRQKERERQRSQSPGPGGNRGNRKAERY